MAILDGFIRTKRFRKLADGSYKLQSEATHESSVFFDDGTTLTEKIVSHPQNASDITGGAFAGQVSAPTGTDYESNRIRNAVLLPESKDPGANVKSSLANGSIIFIYE